jgi:putative transposase
VLLPDHLHCLWTPPARRLRLPDALDADQILLHPPLRPPALKSARSATMDRKRLQPVWQQRYWEHQIRDGRDFQRHCDYIHYNPIKHGHVTRAAD